MNANIDFVWNALYNGQNLKIHVLNVEYNLRKYLNQDID